MPNSEIKCQRLLSLLTLVGFSGIVLLFMPFAEGIDVSDGWEWIGPSIIPGVVLPFLISLGYLVWIIVGRLPRWANAAGYVVAIATSAAALSASDWSSPFGGNIESVVFSLAIFLVVPAICISLGVVRGLTGDIPVKGLAASQSIYALWMVCYLEIVSPLPYDIGAWLGGLTIAVYFVQIGLVVDRLRWLPLFVAPSASVLVIHILDRSIMM
jgi:hypothetical protein